MSIMSQFDREFMPKILRCAVLILAFAAAAPAADSLLKYEQRVQRASEITSRIKAKPADANEFIDDIKTLLPKSEQVDFGGGTIWVDNSWLHVLLDTYKHKSAGDKGSDQLDEAKTKLSALREQLLRLENEPNDRTNLQTSRDNLNRILARQEFKEKKEDFLTSLFRRVREGVIRAVTRLLASLWQLIFGNKGESGWLFRGFVIFVATAFLVGAAVMLAMRRPIRKKPRARRQIILDEEIGPNTTSKDLLNDALTAYKKGEYRLGIRRLYIALLYELGEHGIIELDRHATNNEYMRKAAAVAPLEGPMRYLTERFDYFWYGRFPAGEADFSAYKANFDRATQAAESVSSQKNILPGASG
jgi:hypothetical protein